MLLQAHPTGNAFVHQLAIALIEHGLMDEFHTCLDYPDNERWFSLLPDAWTAEARRRRLPSQIKPYARLHPGRELGRLLGHKLGLGAWIGRERSPCSVDGVYRGLDRQVARRLARKPHLRGVYLYEDGADRSFSAAKARGVKTFYDLPIGYWRTARKILSEEAIHSPEWAGTLRGNFDSEEKLGRKDQELMQADTVFVASSFTRSTLQDAPTGPRDVVLVSYGAPPVQPGAAPAKRESDQPLRVLFVGSLGQRKGLRYLVEAMHALGGGFELTLIGRPPAVECRPLARALQIHRHIPGLPHALILEEMRRHHVLVFPSLFEGFGLVLLEAMACGLPVIATPHTAAPDVITPGIEGQIVPIRSAEAIAVALTQLAENESLRQGMAEAALQRARVLTWTSYRREMAAALRSRIIA